MLPIPIPPITIRSLAAGRSLLPSAAEVMMKGTPKAAPVFFRKLRRVDFFFVRLMGETSELKVVETTDTTPASVRMRHRGIVDESTGSNMALLEPECKGTFAATNWPPRWEDVFDELLRCDVLLGCTDSVQVLLARDADNVTAGHGIAPVAERDGDAVGYLLGKVAEIKGRRFE